MPVNQQYGVHLELPQLVSILSFDSVKDYEDYISRLNKMPRLLEQNIVQMQKGVADRLMPPRFLLEKIVEQANGIASQTPGDSPFAQPFKNFPKSISEAEQARLREQGIAAIRDAVLPAYARFAKFVRDDYVPHGRTEAGVWSLPDGDNYYAYLVKLSTTTDLSPEQIHQMGLAQVQEIEERMKEVATQLGYKDLKSFNAAIAVDPKLHAHSRQQILDLYKKYIDQMYPKRPELFGRLPKAKLEVMPVEEFREKGLPELPPFRKNEYYTAYTEGWALYAERLGKEVGFYQDPYSYYGHLQDDMLRAIRLVVDTGLHYKHWTRQQVVDFFHEHSPEDEVSVQSETDRYIADPAQALGYKIGQLEILELRQYAKDQLGDKFEIRAFHDELLNGGALPMDVLKERMQEWVEIQKTSPAEKRRH